MKILIYGAGVVGCTYGWQLSRAGHDITVLVRKGKKELMEKSGICIRCSDFREGRKRVETVVFRPEIIDELSPENEYIIVSTNNIYLKDILPILAKSSGKAHILFFQNMWDDFDEIAKHLSPEQYFFGFPFLVGGGRDEEKINSVISGLRQSNTMLGELNGETTVRVQKMAKTMEEANLKPLVSKQIKNWLITHYAIAAGLSGGIMKAGDGKAFSANTPVIKEAVKAIREGFAVCEKRGVDVKSEKVNKPYYIPLFILIPVLKKIYGSETLRLMFDGHIRHSPEEMKKMLDDIIKYGEKYNMEMPHLKGLYHCIQV